MVLDLISGFGESKMCSAISKEIIGRFFVMVLDGGCIEKRNLS